MSTKRTVLNPYYMDLIQKFKNEILAKQPLASAETWKTLAKFQRKYEGEKALQKHLKSERYYKPFKELLWKAATVIDKNVEETFRAHTEASPAKGKRLLGAYYKIFSRS